MKRKIWMQGILFLGLVMAVPAFSQNTGEGEIPVEEYEIYKLVIQEIGGASSVSSETLQGAWADYQLNDLLDRINPDPELVRNFNDKNAKKHPLSESFVLDSKKEPSGPLEEKRRITFSRVGFDLKKGHGLLVAGLTYALPEDVMNEGKYVFLSQKEGQWRVDKIVRAWDMRLGPL